MKIELDFVSIFPCHHGLFRCRPWRAHIFSYYPRGNHSQFL